jgi:hypothetical protein
VKIECRRAEMMAGEQGRSPISCGDGENGAMAATFVAVAGERTSARAAERSRPAIPDVERGVRVNPGRFADQPDQPQGGVRVGVARGVLWMLLAAAMAGNVVANAVGANVVFHLASIALSGVCTVALTAWYGSASRGAGRRR